MSMLDGENRWAEGSAGRDFRAAVGPWVLVGTGAVALGATLSYGVPGLLSRWPEFVGFGVLLGGVIAAGLANVSPLRVGANEHGFAIVYPGRGRSRTDRFEAMEWGALQAGPRPVWVPFVGRRYPVRIEHAAGLRSESALLTRAQAELLAFYPGGAGLRSLLA